MFEGKNIHYSALDKKPLCSFSVKICRQRRLNGYAFCVRHILEDPTAPFKACAYVAKSHRHKCSNPVPKHDERRYCNSHMQVLSGVRREKKTVGKIAQTAHPLQAQPVHAPPIVSVPVAQPGSVVKEPINCTSNNGSTANATMLDNRMTLQDRLKTKFNLCHNENGPEEDLDDPYAFPDPVTEPVKTGQSPVQSGPPSVSEAPATNHVTTSLTVGSLASAPLTMSTDKPGVAKVATPENTNPGLVSIAKLYPELAEKLERARGKPEVKLKLESKSKSCTKSSMSRLQTKIAQNRIKDKLKKNQSHSNQTTPEYQPSTPQPQLSPVPSTGQSALQTALASEPAVSSKLAFSTSTINANVKNALSNMLKSEAGAVTSIPVGLPRQLLQHTPAPPRTVSSQPQTPPHPPPQLAVNHQPNEQHLHVSLQLHSLCEPRGLQAPPPSSVSSHLMTFAHLSPAHATNPPKVADIGAPDGSNTAPPTTSAPSGGGFMYQQQHNAVSPLRDSSHGTGVLELSSSLSHGPPPYPHHKMTTQAHRPQPAQTVVPASVLGRGGIAPVLPPGSSIACHLHPPPAYPHPPPTLSLTSVSAAVTTTTTATTVLPPPTLEASPVITSPSLSSPLPSFQQGQLHTRRHRNVLTAREARRRLRRHSAVKVYAYHANQKVHSADLLPFGLNDASDDSDIDEELPWQHGWFAPSSDEENEDEEDDCIPAYTRTAKLALLRARLRRQFSQLRKSYHANVPCRMYGERALQTLLVAARRSATAAKDAILEIRGDQRPQDRHKKEEMLARQICYYKGEEGDVSCRNHALPYTNHCVKHIMNNVDQQMFEYCTAKFSDNTQCCIPVFDTRHELPLCPEHAAKADNYNKNPEPRPKKPRKKTKPSALTRPPKKGKKKKNQRRNVRPQKPMPPLEPTGNTAMPETDLVDLEETLPVVTEAPRTTTTTVSMKNTASTSKAPHMTVPTTTTTAVLPVVMSGVQLDVPKDLRDIKDLTHDLDKMDELEELSTDVIDKSLELPLDSDQATKFLDEHDLHDVLNRLPEEAFDIFTGHGLSDLSKNGEFCPSKEETEALELALAEVSQDVDCFNQSLQKLSQSSMLNMTENDNDDDIAKQIADQILHQNLSPSHLDEDLNQDNITDLACTISASDLKTFSQALSSTSMNPSLSNDLASHPHLPPNSMAQMNTHHQSHLQTLQIIRGHAPVQNPGVVQGQTGQGQMPVIQAQFTQGHLPQGQLHIQMPGLTALGTTFTISPQGTLIPTVSNSQPRQLIAEHPALQNTTAFSPGDLATLATPARFNNGTTSLSPNITLTPTLNSQLSGQHVPTSTSATTQVQWPPSQGLAGGEQGHGHNTVPISFQNRFPIMQPHGAPGFTTANLATLTPGGMKLAYPIQGFVPTELSAMLSAAAPSAGGQPSNQDFSLSLPTQTLTAQPAFNVATTTVASSNQRQPSANT